MGTHEAENRRWRSTWTFQLHFPAFPTRSRRSRRLSPFLRAALLEPLPRADQLDDRPLAADVQADRQRSGLDEELANRRRSLLPIVAGEVELAAGRLESADIQEHGLKADPGAGSDPFELEESPRP